MQGKEVWMSTYNIDNRDPQQASKLTPFKSLDEVVEMMGEEFIARNGAMVIYGDDFHRTSFSHIKVKHQEDVRHEPS